MISLWQSRQRKYPEVENENLMTTLKVKQQMHKELLDLKRYHVNRNVIEAYKELVM